MKYTIEYSDQLYGGERIVSLALVAHSHRREGSFHMVKSSDGTPYTYNRLSNYDTAMSSADVNRDLIRVQETAYMSMLECLTKAHDMDERPDLLDVIDAMRRCGIELQPRY